MKFTTLCLKVQWRPGLLGLALLFSIPVWSRAQDAGLMTIPVDSPAFVFSPGNWVGDEGRGGKGFRQTWNAYAYCRVAWESDSQTPRAKLLLDTSMLELVKDKPKLGVRVDGVWKAYGVNAPEIVLTGLAMAKGRHEVTVVLQYTSEGYERWGKVNQGAPNVLRIKGIQVDPASKPIPSTPQPKWALIIGDSITEGVGASFLSPYSYLLGRALQTQGYEFCVSACGRTGWTRPGSGGVPAFYMVKNPAGGREWAYDDVLSRWNKIDGNKHPLLDADGRLSAYGERHQEPSLIFINYGTNDRRQDPRAVAASVAGALGALRKSAPRAYIVLMIPFGWGSQYMEKEIQDGVKAYLAEHPGDKKVSTIDLGALEARNLDDRKEGGSVVLPPDEKRVALMGSLHPNALGHAIFASMIIPQVMSVLNSNGSTALKDDQQPAGKSER